MDPKPDDEWILIGRVIGPFGVRGEVKVESYSAFPDRFSLLKQVHLGHEHRPYGVLGSRQHKHVLLRLSGVDSPEQVNALRGEEVWVPRSEAVPLPEGEYYPSDVIGLEVFTTEGEKLGHVSDILLTGSNDVYVVEGSRGETLVPAIHEVVRDLDVPGGRIVVEVVPGLLE